MFYPVKHRFALRASKTHSKKIARSFKQSKSDAGGGHPMTEPKDYKIAAVDRALALLEALADRPDQGVTSLAKSLGMTKSLVFRLLHTLEERGFVSRDPEHAEYALGYRIGVLGERLGKDGALLYAARPVMDVLRDKTSENVNLVVREGLKTYVLATRAGRHSIRLFAQARRHPPRPPGGRARGRHAKTHPAGIHTAPSQPLEAFTPYTITDRTKLRQMLERIRANGYNIVLNDLDEGAFSVAAPITGADGTIIASISVAGAVARFDEERRESHLKAALEAAAEISERLSIHGPGESDRMKSRA
jgi:DNA-binding IclR family transcriptional regulator